LEPFPEALAAYREERQERMELAAMSGSSGLNENSLSLVN
jgi:hypothetical protein